MLIWNFDIIKRAGFSDEDFPQVLFSRSYKDGKPFQVEKDQKQLIFLSYLALFPGKEVVKIKLGVEGLTTYSAYYFAKKYFHQSILGVLNVQEYESKHDFEWVNEEELANVFLENFYKFFLAQPIGSENEFKAKLQEFTELLDQGIEYNYIQWKKGKEAYVNGESEKKRAMLAEMFISTIKNKEAEEKDQPQKKSKLKLKEIKEEEKPKDIIVVDEQNNGSENREPENDWKYLKNGELKNLTIRWDFQLINEFGAPLCKIIKFEDGEQIPWGTQEEQSKQSLESMTYSVLRTLITEKMNLKHMVFELPENRGRTFLLFQNFVQRNHNYLILMNVENYDSKNDRYIGKWKGNERETLERIAKQLEENSDWFQENGALTKDSCADEIESCFYRECKRAFKKFERKL